MLSKLIYRILLLPYVATCVFLLIIFFLVHFDPSGYALGGISVLIYPFVLFITIIATIVTLIVRWKMAIPGVLILLMTASDIRMIFAVQASKSFNAEKKQHTLRVMTWNVRAFMPLNEQIYDVRKTSIDDIVRYVGDMKPDIICLQEFFTYTRKYRKNLEIIEKLGYPYHAFADKVLDDGELRTGIIIFSKYPIIKSRKIEIPEKFADGDESPIMADIKIGNDTVSVLNIHLQSYGFREHEYKDLAKIRSQEDKELKATRNIFRKMRKAIEYRNRQSDLLGQKIKNTRLPLIVCGDLNDVPASYAYKTIRGELNDSFLENGFGLGKSFVSGRSRVLGWLPTLRIDYIFHDEVLRSTQFKMLTNHHSDHHGLITDMELPKN